MLKVKDKKVLKIEFSIYVIYIFFFWLATSILLEAVVFSAIFNKDVGDFFIYYLLYLAPVLFLWWKIDKSGKLRGKKKFLAKAFIATVATLLWLLTIY